MWTHNIILFHAVTAPWYYGQQKMNGGLHKDILNVDVIYIDKFLYVDV